MELTLVKNKWNGIVLQYLASVFMTAIAMYIVFVGKRTPAIIVAAAGIQTLLSAKPNNRLKIAGVITFSSICILCIASGFMVSIAKGIKLSAISAILGILLYTFNRAKPEVIAPSYSRERLVVTDYIQDPRWITMLEDVLRGDPYKSIAIDFNVSESAVKKVMTKVYKRFDVASREELIKRCSACEVIFPKNTGSD